ncbi:MAG: 1-deoxy-D-xylulose-5-phosphate reductoisomerase [Gammaproteobacteria bacterium]
MGKQNMNGVTILGSTGTIGVNTLDVITRHKDDFKIVALTANNNVALMTEQCIQWNPRYTVMCDADAAEALRKALRVADLDTEVLSGAENLARVAALTETDSVMAGIVGAAGLIPTLAAAREGKRVMLANKEALVMSGQLFMDAVHENHAELLPIDSEHNAIFQCMPRDLSGGLDASGITRILLTASGGPFRTRDINTLGEVTPAEACAHPNWVMGQKISVDSATMMNKGLEIIEACWLFETQHSAIEVVIHPQSVIHSMVEYSDGSVLAQLGNPDMRTPIAYALNWPKRIESGVERLNLFDIKQLDFEPPNEERFPLLGIARAAMDRGGTATTIMNAANEELVAAFLNGTILFTDIPLLIEETLAQANIESANSLEQILAADEQARDLVREYIRSRAA